MDTTVSVIGPDQAVAERVAAALREVPGASRHRIVVGAGPGAATGKQGAGFGVVAVVPSPCTAEDARVVRAVRSAVGGCVLYAEGAGDGGEDREHGELSALVAEPGVVTVRWPSGGVSDAAAVADLRTVLDGMWVDVPHWIADARRADADRADRVRIAVRLAADGTAEELLDGIRGQYGRSTTVPDTATLDAAFRARLTVAVLEQGVEMPNLADPAGPDVSGPGTGVPRPDRSALVLSAVAAAGAALAAGAGAARVIGGSGGAVAGAVVAVTVAALVLTVRWRTLVAASRQRAAEEAARGIRRRWTATVADVVARLRVPSVAEAVTAQTGVRR
jgi:hypothetical protein